MFSFRAQALITAFFSFSLTAGCSDNGGSSDAATGGANTGGNAGAAGQSGATLGGGVAMGGGGMAGNESVSGAAGSSSGAAGASGAGGSGGGAGGAGACSKMGTQDDPGTMGDGKQQLDGPYKPAPETQMRDASAMVGTINGMPAMGNPPAPLIYAATKAYPGIDQMLKYEYWIYVPAQYKAGCPAALMVFQDGMHYVSTDSQFHAPVVFDNLIARGDMPVTIGVFINPGEPGSGHYDGNEHANRSQQYDRNSPDYSTFLVDQFLADVVLPKYDIVDDPNGWAISGHSSGGSAAFTAGWYRPEKFHKLLTHDASFAILGQYMGQSMMSEIDQKALQPLRVYLMSGPNDLGGWYDANTNAFNHLTAKQYHVRYITETSGHFPPQAGIQDFSDALRWMWRGYRL